jgi:hypothetical protein
VRMVGAVAGVVRGEAALLRGGRALVARPRSGLLQGALTNRRSAAPSSFAETAKPASDELYPVSRDVLTG